jgi:hypothetical protein
MKMRLRKSRRSLKEVSRSACGFLKLLDHALFMLDATFHLRARDDMPSVSILPAQNDLQVIPRLFILTQLCPSLR